MALRTAWKWLIPLLFSLNAIADDISLNPSHPERYLVVQGDTLWDVAGKFLKNPRHWPRVWKSNPAIKNPDLIYPGDVLAFSMVNGQPQISVAQRNSRDASLSFSQGVEKLSPTIRETPLTQAITVMPTKAIARYITSPRVVSATELDNAPYVLSFADEHIVGAPGDRLYARAMPDANTQHFTVYRKGQAYVDPDSNEVLGYEAEFVADTSLQTAGDPATLLINKAASEVRSGDRLMLAPPGDITLNYFPRSPEKPISGTIISVLGGVTQIGQYNTVVINKGKNDGLAVGHVLDVVQHGKIIADPYAEEPGSAVVLPSQVAGSLMIFRTFDNLSYGLIMQASHAIHSLDKVQSP